MQAIPIAECYLPYTASLRVEMILESYAKVYLINSRLEIARFS